MTSAMQIALTATPLAAYFYILGVFHSGRRPKMVSGPVDFGMLTLGLGGLVTFGPFGRAVLGRVVGESAGPLAWSCWVALVGAWAVVLAWSASLRVTVYHISPGELGRAVGEALEKSGWRFTPTLQGFEDMETGLGVTVKPIRWLRSGSVEASGRASHVLIQELKPRLAEALARSPQHASGVSHALFGLACLTMLVPVSAFFFANPRAKEALRTLMQSLRWW